MNTCPVCYENRNLVTLGCSHSFCSSCLDRWTTTCPMCRANIDSSILDISTNDLVLEDSNPRSLNISISSPKGTSLPIQDNELQILTNIFGNLIEINYCNINLCDKVVFRITKIIAGGLARF